MKQGDKMLWDSGFGYEEVEFVRELGEYYLGYHLPVEVIYLTGSCVGQNGMCERRQLIPYTTLNQKNLEKKYRRIFG